MNKLYFQSGKKLAKRILLKNSNYLYMTISHFNIMKSHSYYLNRYKKTEYNFSKFFVKFINYISNHFKFEKKVKLKNEIVFVSSLTNLKKTNTKDNYFNHIINELKISKFKYDIIYRNISKIDTKNKRNICFTSLRRNFVYDFFYSILILFQIIKIFLNNFLISNKSEKIFLVDSISIKNILSSVSNIIETNKIIELVKESNSKKVFFTLEGYAWEKLLCYKLRKLDKKIKIYGYYFSIISKYQFFPFEKIDKIFLPDLILTSGEIARKKFISKNHDKNKIVNIGSYKNYCFKFHHKFNFKCLILAEASIDELESLIQFANNVSKSYQGINFTLRTHPDTLQKYNKKFVKDLIKNQNITFSQNTLLNDIKNCSTILYRSSGSAIQAGMLGSYPINLKKNNELSIDPLYEINKFKLSACSDVDFIKIISKLKNNNYYRNKTEFISKYCKKYFDKPLRQNIKSIIND